MATKTPWTLLRGGTAEQQQGLQQLQRTHARARNGSTIMELGVAHLWLYQYQQAWEHFSETIKEFRMRGDAFYGMAGVAKWCLEEPSEAVSQWRAGLGANYARASGLGIRMPLLLFFASVLRPEISDRAVAKELMLEKVKDPRITTWPGPIAQLVLGQISDGDLQDQCRGNSQQDTRGGQRWLAEFYRSLIGPEQWTLSVFKEFARQLTDTHQPEWRDEDFLLSRIWNEEFFLARHAAI